MILQGRDLIIKLGNTAIAAAKSCRIKISADLLPVSSPTTGQWKCFTTGQKEWSVDVSGLVMVDKSTLPTSLPSHLQTIKGWVGESFTLKVNINPSQSLIPSLPFDGMGTSVSTQSQSYSGWPDQIIFDEDNDRFIGEVMGIGIVPRYYTHWTGSEAYSNPVTGSFFMCNGALYKYNGETLQAIGDITAFSGTAICKDADIAGALGNLTTYAAQFLGSGPLSDPTTT